MLRITFSPPGAEPRTFEMADPTEDLGALEAELIEESGGRQWGTFMEWGMLMGQGSLRAVRVLLWVLLRRENPALELASFDFPVTALGVEQYDDRPCQNCGKNEAAGQHDGEGSHKYEPVTEPEGKDEASDVGTSSP